MRTSKLHDTLFFERRHGFAALGLDIFPVTDKEEGGNLLHRLVGSNYEVIYMTEQLGEVLSADREEYAEQVLPAIILIPGVFGNTGEGIQKVKDSVEQAVGSDILFGDM
ncbi:MAG: V-type ATP synthase subunit F [Lachnospiraceae bacterium]|nr:V-type ATP synthase subunit F [Lachnospiraceae bacterium]